MPKQDSQYQTRSGIQIEWVTIRNRTIYAIVACVVTLLLSAVGGYLYMTRPPVVDDSPGPATPVARSSAVFSELNGSVKVRKAGDYQWTDAHMGIQLGRNDRIRTVGNSSARVRLLDGSEYTVKPDTILVIQEMHEDPDTRVTRAAVKLSAGQVDLQTAEAFVPGSRSDLTTNTTRASFQENTSAMVGYDESTGVTTAAVFKGRSSLEAGNSEVALENGQMVTVSDNSTFGDITDLPGVPIPESPSDYMVLAPQRNLELSWKTVEGAKRYRVLLDRDPRFIDPIYEGQVRGKSLIVQDLSLGTYYWQVSAVDDDDVEGGFSASSRFTISQSGANLNPPALEVSKPTVAVDGLVTLKGKTDPHAIVSVHNGERVDRIAVEGDGRFTYYFNPTRAGSHEFVVKAYKPNGGTTEQTVVAVVGAGSD